MRFCKYVLLVASFTMSVASCLATTYYVSPTGNDASPGTSPSAAWLSVARVNAAQLASGDQVLFQRGGIWREMLVPNASGLYFGAYGTGAKPIIDGADVVSTPWASVSGNVCKSTVGGNDMTNVWLNQVVGRQVASVSKIVSTGDWFYSAGVLNLYLPNGCGTGVAVPTVEVTRRPEALLLDKIGSITVEHLAFVDGMYNSIKIDANVTGVQAFSDVNWTGAAYEGFLALSGAPTIKDSIGTYSLSGLAAGGGAGFTLTNSILSGNRDDAVEVYNTTGQSMIQGSTISGNATSSATDTTINNWSSSALIAENSILLANPYIPKKYNFVNLTDHGTNIQASPMFSSRAAPLIVIPSVDDYNNLSVAEQVASLASNYGCHISYQLNTKLVSSADWSRIQALQAAGNEIVAHSRSHSDLANNNVFVLTYNGPASSATVTVNQSAGTLQTFLNGSTSPDLSVPILDKYNSVDNMCATIQANSAYSCTIQDNQHFFTPLNLADVSGANIKTGYMLTASANYLNWEVNGAKQDIEANMPGYTPTTFATPFTSSNQTVNAFIQGAGFLANRNGVVDVNLNPTGEWALSNINVYSIAGDWLPDAFDPSNITGSMASLVEGLGAAGGVVAVYAHGFDEFSLGQWKQLFQAISQMGATCMTLGQARAYIGSHGTLVQDGTGQRWAEQIPLTPVFSNTPSSPVQGAHGLQ